MCGIAGTTELNEITRPVMRFLACFMESRGSQSWGCTNGYDVYKTVGAITTNFKFPDWAVDGEPILLHTRAASTGSVCAANSHPFTAMRPGRDPKDVHSYVVGVHNGVIHQHEEFNKKYNRNFQVDSQHIFQHIAEDRDTSEFTGYGALLWFDTPDLNDDRYLYLCKFNMQDIHVYQLETGECIFASTKTAVEKTLQMLEISGAKEIITTSEMLYKFIVNKENKWTIENTQKPMKFGFRGARNAVTCVTEWGDDDGMYGAHGTYYRNTSPARNTAITVLTQRRNTKCIIHKCDAKINPTNEVLCGKHYALLVAAITCPTEAPDAEEITTQAVAQASTPA